VSSLPVLLSFSFLSGIIIVGARIYPQFNIFRGITVIVIIIENIVIIVIVNIIVTIIIIYTIVVVSIVVSTALFTLSLS